ncbi:MULTISPECIES: alpha/beta fold hydrolase [Bosea]|uniref:alpha/beta fold hydrolase n=1 Tax=Bosea TaxID=85413 RepID=UPI00214FD9FA|nr:MULTISPECIES: alpha/beta hydrolase [Bosea]MCR4520394.1 alpha/beta hydrolase [Bosea sp. 47.2.35]MDR6827746.1 pimeloyl-ACP methyl ester carboxylesterase [Bosea robiniae]MDR6894560.1 pimeloyl-ACP methyl ester carboxylesterase [Bosea sp. BE109]MDR7137852.1 pimeloyl-ACP methyl ester carboxylesterase [Bosea sp. BE168]MDR7174551.1 pimeloyl-ACP methyl ester carboxylesterase [Bosea sp. BE271]
MPESGFTSRFVSASDGLKLHYRDYGPLAATALPVICLPGFARTAADFHEVALALSQDEAKPRRVLALDYRGRGLSDYDKNWKNYDIRVELDDLIQVLVAGGIEQAIFVGTSRGGLLTMALGAARPAMIRGVVFNDVGPVIDARGLLRIRGYVGKLPMPRSFQEGAEILKRLSDQQFPILGDAEWEMMARRTWTDRDGALKPDYDVRLMKVLEELDLEAPLPVLWTYFDALKTVPMLAIRGANSDLLAEKTLEEMAERHPDCETHTAPGQGHAPLLGSKDMIRRIAKLVARAERRAG